VAGGKKQWVASVTAYTLAGATASAFVGAVLGSLGRLLLPEQVSAYGMLIAIAVAVLAITRELGVIALPLPQLRRQTQRVWAMYFPRTLTAVLWGGDLGLIFTTQLTFSGPWLLASVAVLVGEPAFGMALLALHWLGRALSVWIAPLLLRDAGDTPRLLDMIAGQHRLFQRIHALGLAWSVIVLFITWLMQGHPV
jgi:hypothetical protein